MKMSKVRAYWESIVGAFSVDEERETESEAMEITIETKSQTESKMVEREMSFNRAVDMIQLGSGDVQLVVYDRVYDDEYEREYCRFSGVHPERGGTMEFHDTVTTVYAQNIASVTTIGSYSIDVEFEVEMGTEYLVVENYDELPGEIKDGDSFIKLQAMQRLGYNIVGDYNANCHAYNRNGFTNERPFSHLIDDRPAYMKDTWYTDVTAPELTYHGSVAEIIDENVSVGSGMLFVGIDGRVTVPESVAALPGAGDE